MNCLFFYSQDIYHYVSFLLATDTYFFCVFDMHEMSIEHGMKMDEGS